MPNANQQPSPPFRNDGGSTQEAKPATAEPVSNTLSDALMGTDPPIEKAHPGLQPALVFASYPIALVVLVAIVAIYFVMFRSSPPDSNTPAVHSESSK